MTTTEPAGSTAATAPVAEAARPPWTTARLRGRQALLLALEPQLAPSGARLVLRGPLGVGKASLLAAWHQTSAADKPLVWLDAQQHSWLDSLRQLATQAGWREEARPDATAMLQHVAQWLASRDGTLAVRHDEVASKPAWRALALLRALPPTTRVVLLAESINLLGIAVCHTTHRFRFGARDRFRLLREKFTQIVM